MPDRSKHQTVKLSATFSCILEKWDNHQMVSPVCACEFSRFAKPVKPLSPGHVKDCLAPPGVTVPLESANDCACTRWPMVANPRYETFPQFISGYCLGCIHNFHDPAVPKF